MEEIKKEIKICTETNDENTKIKNTGKGVLRGKFRAKQIKCLGINLPKETEAL